MTRRKSNSSDQNWTVRCGGSYPFRIWEELYELSPTHLHDHPGLERLKSACCRRDPLAFLGACGDLSLQSIGKDPELSTYDKRWLLQLGNMCKKFPFEIDSIDREQATLAKFAEADAQCGAVNRRLRCVGRSEPLPEPLKYAREFILRVMGSWDLIDLTHSCRHGPGASVGCKGTSAFFKYTEIPYAVTAGALPYAQRLIESDQRWVNALEGCFRQKYGMPRHAILDPDLFWAAVFEVVPGNKITTVPKDGMINRPIAIEPVMNMVLQLGVDGYVRKRLRRWGINLNSQRKNQVLAMEGSLDPSLNSPVTIDLSSASDTISLRIAKILLPEDLYQVLVDLRSPTGLLPNGERIRFRKLSSMGNGSTFVIETLLFASLVYATFRVTGQSWQRNCVAVYGDDIIVPAYLYNPLRNLLSYCGFWLNNDKSFTEGPVRESCGTDWVSGRDVRPVYLRNNPENICDLFSDRNRLRRWLILTTGERPDSLDECFRRWLPCDPNRFAVPCSDEEFSSGWHCEVPPNCDVPLWDKTQFNYSCAVLIERSKQLMPPVQVRFRSGRLDGPTQSEIRTRLFLLGRLMAQLAPNDSRSTKRWLRPLFWQIDARAFVMEANALEARETSPAFAITRRNQVIVQKSRRCFASWQADYCSIDGTVIGASVKQT